MIANNKTESPFIIAPAVGTVGHPVTNSLTAQDPAAMRVLVIV
jgi:hypothetical protein